MVGSLVRPDSPPAMTLEILFHIGNAITLIAFLFRDQIQLRAVMALSMVLQGLYYIWLPGGPWFDPLLWKVLTAALNIVMIIILFRDRFGFDIDAELRPLFEAIHVLNPGQFRRLIKLSGRAEGPKAILTRGKRPNELYYLLKGTAEVSKDGRRLSVGPGAFLGEIAFLSGDVATADVRLAEGSEVLVWPAEELKALMSRDGNIDIGVRGVLSHDLAMKTARSHLPTAEPAERPTATAVAE